MTYSECIKEIKKIHLDSVRNDTPDYFEFVTRTDLIENISGILVNFFGSVTKPANTSPSKETVKHAAPYGGIRKDQTLFYLEDDSSSYLTMFWPWGNNVSITVKMFMNPKNQ
jgi:hypothetical protein